MNPGRRSAVPALIVALVLTAPSGLRAQQHFPPTGQLELMLRYWVEDGETPGVALAVLEPDGSTRVATYGVGPAGGPVTPETPFPIGEVTMTLTAALLAEMVARGEVSLDDPVAMYMPEGVEVPSLSGYAITLEHLAKHRSGLPAEPPAPYDDFDLEALHAFLAEYELDWVPGRSRETSVVGYGLLGHALARAAGQPFDRLLRERVLAPLGMTDTGYGSDVGPGLRGGTGLRSSAADLAAFLAANAGPAETALEEATRAAHEVGTGDGPDGDEGYGFSWRTTARRGQPLRVSHGGRTPGSTALVHFAPAPAIGTVVLAASGDFNDWAARDLLYFPSPAHETVDVDPEVLRQYVGSYGSRDGLYRAIPNSGSVFIRLEDDGHLTYQPRSQLRTPLFPIDDSVFYMARAPLTVTFDRIGDDMEMTVFTDGREPESGWTWRRWRVDMSTPRPDVAAGNAAPWTAWRTGTWLLVGLVGVVAVVLILRPLWARRPAGSQGA